MNCCLIASHYIIVEIVFFGKIWFTESVQNCFIWTVLWFCSWLYNIWVDTSEVKERGFEVSDPYISDPCKHCVGQSLGSWNAHNLWVIAERPIDFKTLVLGRMAICPIFLFSIWDICLRIWAGCNTGEAIFPVKLADGILSVE